MLIVWSLAGVIIMNVIRIMIAIVVVAVVVVVVAAAAVVVVDYFNQLKFIVHDRLACNPCNGIQIILHLLPLADTTVSYA